MRAFRSISVLALVGVLGFTVIATADEGDTDQPAAVDDVEVRVDKIKNCYRKAVPDAGGSVRVKVPNFCVKRMCHLNLLWTGDPIGALAQGFGWGADFVQFSGRWWVAGPAVGIAGWQNPTDGLGRNGDGVEYTLFAGAAADGSTISLVDDDPGFENHGRKFTLELDQADPSDPAFFNVQFWACKMG